MKTTDSKTMLSQPNMFTILRAGFDVVSNHIHLLIFPIALDMLIWLGPHLKLTSLIQSILDQLSSLPGWQDSPSAQLVKAGRELILDRTNLMTALRTLPVGIPSLMSGRSPVSLPGGLPFSWDIPAFSTVAGLWLMLTFVGISLGTLYYLVVAQATLNKRIDWQAAIKDWPKSFLQVVALTILWVAVIAGISLPFSCLVSVIALGGGSAGQIIFFLFGGFLLWLIFPLLFSAHGIFVYQDNILISVMKSVRLTRQTFPMTSLFVLVVLVASQGLDIVWRWPMEDSWMTLIGVAGHAFVVTGLLAASFLYYREVDQWIQKVIRQALLRQMG